MALCKDGQKITALSPTVSQSQHSLVTSFSAVPLLWGKEDIPNWAVSKVPLLLVGERENLKGSGFMDDSQEVTEGCHSAFSFFSTPWLWLLWAP